VEKYEPYIGAGPTINVMKVSGTGYSGIFVSPDAGTMALVGLTPGPGPNISDTTTKIGANVKAGMLYKVDKDMSLGFEYKFNWTPFRVSHFRSQSDLSGDFYSHTISAVLVKNF
jgi:opacity protein-like surface antigen